MLRCSKLFKECMRLLGVLDGERSASFSVAQGVAQGCIPQFYCQFLSTIS